jgi:PLP dependent protein
MLRGSRLLCTEGLSPVASALADIEIKLSAAAVKAGRPPSAAPRLVAVSKTKPVELLQQAYDAGQRAFGENYVQEIVEKAPQLPEDIEWRYIGKLQSNKAKPLVHGVPTLAVVETVDTPKLANKLQAAVATLPSPRAEPLGVMIQVSLAPRARIASPSWPPLFHVLRCPLLVLCAGKHFAMGGQ